MVVYCMYLTITSAICSRGLQWLDSCQGNATYSSYSACVEKYHSQQYHTILPKAILLFSLFTGTMQKNVQPKTLTVNYTQAIANRTLFSCTPVRITHTCTQYTQITLTICTHTHTHITDKHTQNLQAHIHWKAGLEYIAYTKTNSEAITTPLESEPSKENTHRLDTHRRFLWICHYLKGCMLE